MRNLWSEGVTGKKKVEFLFEKNLLHPDPDQNNLRNNSELTGLKSKDILYMSITGNPTHLGHMAAVATAIYALAKKNITVDRAFISLSGEQYHKNNASFG